MAKHGFADLGWTVRIAERLLETITRLCGDNQITLRAEALIAADRLQYVLQRRASRRYHGQHHP